MKIKVCVYKNLYIIHFCKKLKKPNYSNVILFFFVFDKSRSYQKKEEKG
jgi:hypothetical protein